MSSTPPARLFLLRPFALACAVALPGLAVTTGPAWGNDTFIESTPAERWAKREQTQVPSPSPLASRTATGWNLSTLQNLNAATGERLDLAQAWRLTVLNDPDYQAALSARAAAETERRQGRAAILPQVRAGHSRSRIRGDQTQYDRFGSGQVFELDYDSTSTYIQLQQPVINFGRYADFQRGAARAELGVAEFRQREQDTALNLAQVYLRAVRADVHLGLAGQQVKSLEAQAVAQDRLFQADEGNRIDAQETRARLALARSEEIGARDLQQVALRELQALVGRPVEVLAGLSAEFRPLRLQPADLQDWVALAHQQAPRVLVAQAAVKVAETELRRATSRHLPSLDLVAGYAKADSENLSSLSQRTNTWTVGLNASIPLFSGGYDTANRAQASAELDKARQELRAAQESAVAEAIRQHTAVTGGIQRIEALQAAVTSAEQSLAAAQASYLHGLRSNVDVLRSQDRLHDARRQLADARLAYLAAASALWAIAGQLDEARFVEVTNLQLDGVGTPAE